MARKISKRINNWDILRKIFAMFLHTDIFFKEIFFMILQDRDKCNSAKYGTFRPRLSYEEEKS